MYIILFDSDIDSFWFTIHFDFYSFWFAIQIDFIHLDSVWFWFVANHDSTTNHDSPANQNPIESKIISESSVDSITNQKLIKVNRDQAGPSPDWSMIKTLNYTS